MELRGFDSYPLALGDEMRGVRASLGKSLADAERDLRIKSRMIVAIENCDLEGFPNPSVLAGYVRSYARYLGMDPDDCYRRFCEESGYQSPATLILGDKPAGRTGPADRATGLQLARSRFAAPPLRSRFQARVSLGALTSTAALVALIAGLSYGGYALLQDIQRVGFAPLPEAPTVLADAPLIAAPDIRTETSPLPDPAAYLGGGTLAVVAMPVQLQPIEELRRDGPISAIDPQTAGVFVPALADAARIDSADDAIRGATEIAAADGGLAGEPGEPEAVPAAETAALPSTGMLGVALHAAEDAWVRVRERDSVIFEGTLAAGEHYELPARIETPLMKVGNAGGVFVFVDGVAYGPVGRRGQIARDVSLVADDVRAKFPPAASAELDSAMTAYVHQRAEAAATRP